MSRRIFRTTAILFLLAIGAASGTGHGPGPRPGGIGDITSDPFAFYYAYYLPNQQMQAMRPRPSDVINEAVQNRQYYAQTQRRSLYNPISPYAEGDYDPLRPYSQQQGKERVAAPFRFAQDTSNSDGTRPGTLLRPRRSVLPGPASRARSERQYRQAGRQTRPRRWHGWHGRNGRWHGRHGRWHGWHGRLLN